MLKNYYTFFFLEWCLLLVCFNAFSQTEIYKSDFAFDDFKPSSHAGSIIISGENILFNSSNQKMYSINKKEGKINWEIKGVKKAISPYLYNNTFFYAHFENEVLRTAQFDMNTGQKIKDLPFESITTMPSFLNDIMYATVHFDGGKLIAYNVDENKIMWEQNIGFAAEIQPV